MAVEIELKVKVRGHDELRQRLRDVGASLAGKVLERNIFFEISDHSLTKADRGLRLRTSTNQQAGECRHILTYKGPRQPGALKRREELELRVEDANDARALLEALGFRIDLEFEKRRESWMLECCRVELDELPELGTFVEVEGPSEADVLAVQQRLGLAELPLIRESYARLVAHHLKSRAVPKAILCF